MGKGFCEIIVIVSSLDVSLCSLWTSTIHCSETQKMKEENNYLENANHRMKSLTMWLFLIKKYLWNLIVLFYMHVQWLLFFTCMYNDCFFFTCMYDFLSEECCLVCQCENCFIQFSDNLMTCILKLKLTSSSKKVKNKNVGTYIWRHLMVEVRNPIKNLVCL